jgi:hypothetical protein
VADPRVKQLAYDALALSLTGPIDLFPRGTPTQSILGESAVSRNLNRSPILQNFDDGRASMTAYEPTMRERLAAGAQTGLEFLGLRRPQARTVSQGIFGGESSPIPANLGIADVVPFLGTALQTEEAVDSLGRARRLAGEGQYGQAAVETGMGILGLVPGVAGTMQAVKPLVRQFDSSSLQIAPLDQAQSISKTSTMKNGENLYETGREGPFLTIVNRRSDPGQQATGGFRVYGGTAIDARDPVKRSSIYSDAAGETEQELQLRLAPENNSALKVAQQITKNNLGADYNFDLQIEPSSLRKQSAIGASYELAANKLPGYSQTIFDAYKNDPEYGPLIQQLGITNYDDLVRESYKQLEKETVDQFRALPVKMSFHQKGEGNYTDSGEMVKDAHLHNHLFVFQGGEPHEFLGRVDESTGLSSNDMFRAVHDYFGHAIKGNSFGPKGEEIAWASHAQMYSPLARIAMTSETRGQNSFVNYTPINADLVSSMEKLRKAEIDLRSFGRDAEADQLKDQIRELGGQWQYAQQASVALPPEMTKLDYAGGMPEYVRSIQRPEGESVAVEHYSRAPELKMTDPQKQGTAAAGREKTRLKFPGALRGRTYFYAEGAKPEAVVRSIAPYKYKSTISSLYNADKDELGLKKLANVKNTESYLSKINKGAFDADSATNDFERMIYERGYTGLVTGEGKNRIAVSFEPVEVQRQ